MPRLRVMSNDNDTLSLKVVFDTAEVFHGRPPLFPVMHIMKDADMQTPFFVKKRTFCPLTKWTEKLHTEN